METTQKFETTTALWPSHITLVDVTARDGLQDAATFVTTEEKLAFINALLDAGVKTIEATSFMHPRWIPQLADADLLAAHLPRREGVTYTALVPNIRGYERARASGTINEVVLVVSASESHNHANLNRSIDASLQQLAQVAAQARQDGIRLRGAVATAFGCPFERQVSPAAVLRIAQRYAEIGVNEVSLADTIGVAQPRQVYLLFSQVRAALPERISLGAHFHDRSGYALANVFAALQAGATTFDAALGGLGGCPYAPGAPGNLSLEALVAYVEAMGFSTGIALPALGHARDLIMDALAHGEPVTSTHSMR